MLEYSTSVCRRSDRKSGLDCNSVLHRSFWPPSLVDRLQLEIKVLSCCSALTVGHSCGKVENYGLDANN